VDLLVNVPAAGKPTVVATAATPPTMATMAPVDSPAPGIAAPPGMLHLAPTESKVTTWTTWEARVAG
jgi:hypothetical protein